ncbi:uncharacterized protein LOC119362015 isoform X3 [Triticum dicoccoides]|uniref:uncharacterized protein LOC119362015 isoform X3 n=1 Tax=Triticum dicoccoides TaxID=85692 RepID=UPI00188EF799|nr:uncharacterized protein LOC119362015 isoform X3 [Triticum dicoccoides]
MASSVLRSAGRVVRRSIPQGSCCRSPISGSAGNTQLNKYSTSSSGQQVSKVNEANYEDLIEEKSKELTRVVGELKKEFKELELVLEKNDARARRGHSRC